MRHRPFGFARLPLLLLALVLFAVPVAQASQALLAPLAETESGSAEESPSAIRAESVEARQRVRAPARSDDSSPLRRVPSLEPFVRADDAIDVGAAHGRKLLLRQQRLLI